MRILTAVAVCLAVVFLSLSGQAMIMISGQGTWPESWPTALESLREQAKSFEVAHGIQETVYEIQFKDQAQFESLWPALLSVKDEGAPIILELAPSYYPISGSTQVTGVRILCPVSGISAIASEPGPIQPPWKGFLDNWEGTLPEYVTQSEGNWAVFVDQERTGFRFRSRIDLVLLVDGDIVDLNRIKLPADTSIIDHRFATDGTTLTADGTYQDGDTPKSFSVHGLNWTAQMTLLVDENPVTQMQLVGNGWNDEQVEKLVLFQGIQGLSVINGPITDAVISTLKRLPNLERLYLEGTELTEDGFAMVGALERLEVLGIPGASKEVVERIKAASPDLVVGTAIQL